MEIALEVVNAKGHVNVRATHSTTFEITRDTWLTPRGDCIVGINADKAVAHLSSKFKDIASSDNALIIAILECNGVRDVVVGYGSSKLTFTSDRRIVFRRSTYTSGDTVMIKASKAAKDISRELVKLLKDPNRTLKVYLIALKL